MSKYKTVMRSDFDADESFNKAMRVMMKFLKNNEADGKMAMVSLARALGGTLMLTTEEEQRDMALATVITQMCQTFADFLQEEDQHSHYRHWRARVKRKLHGGEIRDNLRTLRINNNLSQLEMAHRLNVKQGTYSKYERGLLELSPEKERLIIKLFNLTDDEKEDHYD